MTAQYPELDRWTEQGLVSAEQRVAILRYEQERASERAGEGPGRLANAISTAGAGIAIFATAGVVAIFAGDWSSGQALLAAAVAGIISIMAAWQLVRNGWGAPAGLLAICGLVLLPVTMGLFTDAMGWWPEDVFNDRWEEVDRERQRIIGIILLLSIVPGMLTTRLGLRQAWMLLPAALWIGATLLVTFTFESTPVQIAQVFFGVAVAAFAAFIWRTEDEGLSSAWWLQAGGLILAAQAAAFSAFEGGSGLALLGAVAAVAIFIVGVSTNRTPWMVAGALASIPPVVSLIFDYFDGLAGLTVVALAGLLVAFLPLMILRRRASHAR